jgi:hypothetical protein
MAANLPADYINDLEPLNTSEPNLTMFEILLPALIAWGISHLLVK